MSVGATVLSTFAELWHALVDVFVRPLKVLFPKEVEFWRPDNYYPYIVKDTKPFGYWLGHILFYIWILVLIIYGLEHTTWG